MSSCIVTQDVRVHHADPKAALRIRAARSAVKFLRRQADALRPSDKDELVKFIWKLYWRAYRTRMLAAPRTTRHMLREQFGFWKVVAVPTPAR